MESLLGALERTSGQGRSIERGKDSGASEGCQGRDLLLAQAKNGIVFVDEVDKIRSHISGEVNTTGIKAQEALLTLIENEAVPLTLPTWAGGGTLTVDSSGRRMMTRRRRKGFV